MSYETFIKIQCDAQYVDEYERPRSSAAYFATVHIAYIPPQPQQCMTWVDFWTPSLRNARANAKAVGWRTARASNGAIVDLCPICAVALDRYKPTIADSERHDFEYNMGLANRRRASISLP